MSLLSGRLKRKFGWSAEASEDEESEAELGAGVLGAVEVDSGSDNDQPPLADDESEEDDQPPLA
jgi:hypothetical protein